MISLQDNIANAIRNWPTLYGCRTDVLHQYFCVPDNGLDWVDGCLLDRYGDSTEAERASMLFDEDEQIAALHERLHGHETSDLARLEAMLRINVRRHNAEVGFRIEHADLLAHVPWLHQPQPAVNRLGFSAGRMAQPITRLSATQSAMFSVPDDVRPDWLAGVREMIFEVFRAQSDHPVTALAEAALTRLYLRFPTPDTVPCTFEMWQQSELQHRSDTTPDA